MLWIWASLVVFVVILVGMYAMASTYFRDVRHAIGAPTMIDIRRGVEPPPALGDPELDRLLMSGRPTAVAAIGLIGIGLLVYLTVDQTVLVDRCSAAQRSRAT